jgi:uncharacterized membrane protein YkoI
MRKIIFLFQILFLLMVFPTGLAWGQDNSLEKCLNAVKQQQSGRFTKVEYLVYKGNPAYELEVLDDQGVEHELICDAGTAEIHETETEVESASDQQFKANIDLETAIQTVLKEHPGKVQEIEYEIEKNGMSTYEIDVVDDHGRETKVEVDAVTGKIIEVSEEKWQIGDESGERARWGSEKD